MSVKDDFILKTKQFEGIMLLTKNSLCYALENMDNDHEIRKKTIKRILLNRLSTKTENEITKAIMKTKKDIIQFTLFASLLNVLN